MKMVTVWEGARGVTVAYSRGRTWTWDGKTGADVTPATSPSPTTVAGHRLAYDAVGKRIVLFGGLTNEPQVHTFKDEIRKKSVG